MTPRRVLLDDRLLIEMLLSGIPEVQSTDVLHCSTYWYYRACRAGSVAGGGHLSGPLLDVPGELQARTVVSLLHLPERIGLPDPRLTVPEMARVAQRFPRLNLLNLEAVAAARTLDAVVWLSPAGGTGLLPDVLDSEGLPWRTVDLA